MVTSIINEVSNGGDCNRYYYWRSPYSYEWKEELIVFGIPFGNYVDSLNAQTYVLEVTDNNGCIYTDTFNLGVYELYVNSISTNTLCFSDTNGSIDISVSNGLSPYTYLWSNGLTSEDISSWSGNL